MFGRKKAANKLVIDSHLAPQTKVDGDVTFQIGMQLFGQVHGDVRGERPDSTLVIGRGAVIKGSVVAATIYVDGDIQGAVRATKLVVVHGNGRVQGDIHYGKIQMEDGARVTGQLVPLPAESSAPAEPGARKAELRVQPA